MTAQTVAQAVEVLLCAAVLLWFFARPWQSLCISALRQQLFDMRDRLFLLGADGRVEFTDPAYVRLRLYFDTCLRFAHQDRFSEMLAGVMALDAPSDEHSELIQAIEDVADADIRQDLRSILRQSIAVRLVHMLLRSPVMVLPVAIIAIASAARIAGMRRLLPRMDLTLEAGHRDNTGDGGAPGALRPT